MAIAVRIVDGTSVFEVTVTSTMLTDKSYTLPITPSSASKVVLDVAGGPAQVQLKDYQVIGNQISWSQMGLEVVLSLNDVLRIVIHN